MDLTAGPEAIIHLDLGSRFVSGGNGSSFRQFLFGDQVLAIVLTIRDVTAHFEDVPQTGCHVLSDVLRFGPNDFAVGDAIVEKGLVFDELQAKSPSNESCNDQSHGNDQRAEMENYFHLGNFLGRCSTGRNDGMHASRLSEMRPRTFSPWCLARKQ